MAQRYTVSTKLASVFVTAVFAAQIYHAATQPIHSGEAYLYDRFVRPTARQTMASELPDRDVLYGLLEKRSVGLFHVSPFSVRLPGVLFGVLYLWSVWQLARLSFNSEWLFLGTVALAGWAALQWSWFERADGVGTALALELCAVWLVVRYLNCNQNVIRDNLNLTLNLAGACLGLSVAARLDFAIPATTLALAFLAVLGWHGQWSVWIDRVFIPAIVAALIFLVLPLSHAHAAAEITPELTEGQARHLQTALQALRATAQSDPIRIGATRSAEPVVNFYRAQHRATTWERARRDYALGHFDYYLLSTAETNWVEQRHLLVLYRDTDFLLACGSYAPM